MDFSSIIGGIGGSLVSGIFGSAAQRKANATNLQIARETNQANRELAEYSYSKELEQWNRQNEYNLPVNQMQRFADAGLNPNLIYGQGSNGNATSSPSFDTPKMESARVQPVDAMADSFGRIGQVLGQYQNFKLVDAQIAKQKADTEKSLAEAEYINKRSSYQSLVSEFYGDTYSDRVASYKLSNGLSSGKISLLGAQMDKTFADTDYVRARTTSVNNQNSIWDSITAPMLLKQLEYLTDKDNGLKIDNETRGSLNRARLNLYISQRIKDIESAGLYNLQHQIGREELENLKNRGTKQGGVIKSILGEFNDLSNLNKYSSEDGWTYKNGYLVNTITHEVVPFDSHSEPWWKFW